MFYLYWISMSQILSMMLITSLMSVYYFRKQLLVMLINMEIVALMLFTSFITTLNTFNQPPSMAFFMSVLSVCEATLGLSLLVVMTRLKGSDMLKKISLHKL